MPKKGENIYKRKDGRWEGRYIKSRNSTGKIVYGYVYARTYHEVKAVLQEKKVLYKVPPVKVNSQLFSSIALEWFESIKLCTKESTQNKYHNMLINYILPQYGQKSIDTITYEFIEAHCRFLLVCGGKKGTGLSPKTVADVLSMIRSIMKFAMRKGICVTCDASTLHIKQTSKPMRVLSQMEQNQLCDFILKEPDPCNIGIIICLFTGLRIGEICALRWEDISFSDRTMHIHHTLQRIQNKENSGKKTKIIVTTPKSAASVRTIPLPDQLTEVLIANQKSSIGYLLTNDEIRFVEPRTMQNKFKKILKSSGIKSVKFHALRHTFATRCIEMGFDVKSLSEILGHSTVNVTMNLYVHPSMETKKKNMQKLSSLLTVR